MFRRVVRVLGWGVSGGLLLTAAGLSVHHVVEDAAFRVYDVHFEGNERTTDTALRHLTDLHTDQHLLTVDLDRVVRGVERHPWIYQASARMSLPSTVTISVTEHEPLMLLAMDDLWYVDARGEPFRRAQSEDLDYPVLTGIDPLLAENNPDIASAVIGRALRVLSQADTPPLGGAESISEIHFNQRTGYTLILRTGTELVLGFSDPAERLRRLQHMVAQGLDLTTPQRIDLAAEQVAIATVLPAI